VNGCSALQWLHGWYHRLALPRCTPLSWCFGPHNKPLLLFVYLHLIIGTLFICISTYLTVFLFSNPVLNLIFLLLPITSSHSHANASDSTFDYWRYINISLTLTLQAWMCERYVCQTYITCLVPVIGASGYSDDITISSWTLVTISRSMIQALIIIWLY